jgi:diguanylate cyclase (GGDEF)-like protein
VDDDRVDDLTTLAKLAGARLGLLRVMAETQLQASTDTLTGLLNRRSFSEEYAAIGHQLYPVAVAMADLDHFKTLNDTYGHETGDRALRLFARVVRDTLRASDVVGRHGGEEFAIAFPDCSAVDATRALNTVRAHLDAAITVGGLPKFTVSFGITEAEPGEEFSTVLRRADSALMLAKQQGRDRIVLHESVGGDEVPSEGRSDLLESLDEEFLSSDLPRWRAAPSGRVRSPDGHETRRPADFPDRAQPRRGPQPRSHPRLSADVDDADHHALKVHGDGKPDVVVQPLYRREHSAKFTCRKGARHRTVKACSNAVRTLQRIEGDRRRQRGAK